MSMPERSYFPANYLLQFRDEVDWRPDEPGILTAEQRLITMIKMNVTQGDLAKELKVSRPFLNRWLHGARKSDRLDKAFATYTAKHGKRKS